MNCTICNVRIDSGNCYVTNCSQSKALQLNICKNTSSPDTCDSSSEETVDCAINGSTCQAWKCSAVDTTVTPNTCNVGDNGHGTIYCQCSGDGGQSIDTSHTLRTC
jgi:hypothetical protein